MKKLNLRDRLLKSGKLHPPKPTRKTKASAADSSDGEGDMSILSEEQKTHIRERYLEVTEHNESFEPEDNDYITQENLRDEFNSLFGVNKSIRSYYRIWNEHEADY